MKNSSFDIVSEFDYQEIVNAVNQTKKEIENRYDFKNSNSKINLLDNSIKIESDSINKLNAINDILKSKMIKRKLSLKILNFNKIETINNGLIKQNINLRKGLNSDVTKKIIKIIKESKLRAQSQIQGDIIRVTGRDIDTLQLVISIIDENNFDIPIQFINYR